MLAEVLFVFPSSRKQEHLVTDDRVDVWNDQILLSLEINDALGLDFLLAESYVAEGTGTRMEQPRALCPVRVIDVKSTPSVEVAKPSIGDRLSLKLEANLGMTFRRRR